MQYLIYGGGHWDFRFCGFGYLLDRFFGFCCKRLRFFGFGGHCGLRIFRFLASGFRFSWKILAVFRFWYPMWFLVFPILSYFGFRFLFDLSSTWSRIAAKRQSYLEECVPPAPATEEAIVDCVAFFYEEGKGGENFRKKNKFRCKVKREERSLQKLKNSVW